MSCANPNHEKELNLYCETCKKFFCLKCETNCEREHRLVSSFRFFKAKDIDSLVKTEESSIENIEKTINSLLNMVTAVSIWMKEEEKNRIESYRRLINEINKEAFESCITSQRTAEGFINELKNMHNEFELLKLNKRNRLKEFREFRRIADAGSYAKLEEANKGITTYCSLLEFNTNIALEDQKKLEERLKTKDSEIQNYIQTNDGNELQHLEKVEKLVIHIIQEMKLKIKNSTSTGEQKAPEVKQEEKKEEKKEEKNEEKKEEKKE